jgi:hypothetical protein
VVAEFRADLRKRWVSRGRDGGVLLTPPPHYQDRRSLRSRSTRGGPAHLAFRHSSSAGATSPCTSTHRRGTAYPGSAGRPCFQRWQISRYCTRPDLHLMASALRHNGCCRWL